MKSIETKTKFKTMKKIINGKVYNTETATLIANYHNNLGRGDFNFLDEDLYRTKKGAWFIAGEGGARSKYAVYNGNFNAGGSDIETLSENEAYEWLEAHEKTDIIEELFPDRIEEA